MAPANQSKASAVLPTRPDPTRPKEPQQNRRSLFLRCWKGSFQGVPVCPPGREAGFGSPDFMLHWTPWVFSLICLVYAGLATYAYHQGHTLVAFLMAGAAITVGAAAVWLFGDSRDG